MFLSPLLLHIYEKREHLVCYFDQVDEYDNRYVKYSTTANTWTSVHIHSDYHQRSFHLNVL